MLKYIKHRWRNLLFTAAAAISISGSLAGCSLLSATSVSASQISDHVCRGILSTEGRLDATNPKVPINVSACRETGNSSFGTITRRIINIFSIVVGAVSVIMIIIGGFRYIISGGDSTGITSAKNTIMYAIIGLVIVLFAQIIIRFVISNVMPIAN